MNVFVEYAKKPLECADVELVVPDGFSSFQAITDPFMRLKAPIVFPKGLELESNSVK